MRKIYFNFRIEELVPLSTFACQSFVNYQKEFINFSSIYDDGFLKNLKAKMEVVNNVVLPKTLLVRLKQETGGLYYSLDAVKQKGFLLKRYVEMAGKAAGVSLRDLNITGLRRACDNRDAEGAVAAMNRIGQLIKPCLGILQAKGYSPAMQAEWVSLSEAVKKGNAAQNDTMNKFQQLAESNASVLNELWDMVNDILRTGRLLFKNDKLKQKEFTLARLRKRVRHEAAGSTAESTAETPRENNL